MQKEKSKITVKAAASKRQNTLQNYLVQIKRPVDSENQCNASSRNQFYQMEILTLLVISCCWAIANTFITRCHEDEDIGINLYQSGFRNFRRFLLLPKHM